MEGGGRGIPENGFNGEGGEGGLVKIKELNCPTVTDSISITEKRNSFNSITKVSIFLSLSVLLGGWGGCGGRHHGGLRIRK